MVKVCKKCKIEKDKCEFRKCSDSKDGLNSLCKLCKNTQDRARYAKDNTNKRKHLKKYYSKNKEKIINYHKLREKEQLQKDPVFKLQKRVSASVRNFLRTKNSGKFGKSISKYIPYTIQELREHIEKQFTSEMNWGNWGFAKVGEFRWQIDHIIPQSKLPYTLMKDENFQKCWALENLRPLEAFENIKKSNKILGK
jgi:hypothetical protein